MLVEAKHLSFRFPSGKREETAKIVLDDLNFTLDKGEKVGLIGCNGVGKSTLLKLLVGLLPADPEQLAVCDLSMTEKNYTAVRQKVGYVFQDSDSQLFLPTVEEDVAFGPLNAGMPEEMAKKRTAEVLKAVHLTGQAHTPVYRLSGGQKRLAAIAGLLAMEPDLLLLDEPSTALDPRNRRNLIQILKHLPCAQLTASHDLDFIMDTCERVILLYNGKIRADGPVQQVLRDKNLLEACGLELPLRLQGWQD